MLERDQLYGSFLFFRSDRCMYLLLASAVRPSSSIELQVKLVLDNRVTWRCEPVLLRYVCIKNKKRIWRRKKRRRIKWSTKKMSEKIENFINFLGIKLLQDNNQWSCKRCLPSYLFKDNRTWRKWRKKKKDRDNKEKNVEGDRQTNRKTDRNLPHYNRPRYIRSNHRIRRLFYKLLERVPAFLLGSLV